ncbi:hypothetical protein ACFO5K_16125 [Nocardia halotolerans]|uniref:Adhesin domain-containing protein n=1 Tax=Nocardia halotolerans TaxID=1755878 RepID=A0ABV8VHU7_9NOCA
MYTFQTPAPITVTVDVLCADVTVIADDRTDTVVEVRPADPAKKADVRAAEHTVVDFAAGTLSVTSRRDWHTHTPFGGNPAIELVVAVPTGSQFTGIAAVGRLFGAGELGRCRLSISLGDIVIERPQESVTAKTAKGDIRIGEAVRGEFRLETSSGELEVGVHPGSVVRMESETGAGAVHNLMDPVASTAEHVHIHARNILGNIIVRHTVAA